MDLPSALPNVPVFNAIDLDMAGQTTGGPRPPGPLADPGRRARQERRSARRDFTLKQRCVVQTFR